MFVSGKPFQPSLMFAGKAEAYPSEAPAGAHPSEAPARSPPE
jgi:hypothetical protein